MATQIASETRIDEVADGIFRISTPVDSIAGGGITYNQYLIVDDELPLFHTGKRRMFPRVQAAVTRVMPLQRLRWISFSHFEADECGALNDFLVAAPNALPVCGQLLAMLSVNDTADRDARTLADGEELGIGRCRVQWLDTPHLPHAWESGLLMEHTRGRCCAATSLLRVEPTIRRSLRATFSAPVMRFVASSTSTTTRRIPERC